MNVEHSFGTDGNSNFFILCEHQLLLCLEKNEREKKKDRRWRNKMIGKGLNILLMDLGKKKRENFDFSFYPRFVLLVSHKV